MDKYYYLTCSLPLLKFPEAPLITRADFMAEAEKWLSEKDLIILFKADINNFPGVENDTYLLKRLKDFEYYLRGQLVSYRRAKRENPGYKLRVSEWELNKIKRDLSGIIQESSNSLEIEKKLLFLRWTFLDEEESGHFFDLDFLIIYRLKLQILERLAGFNKEKGKKRFEVLSVVEFAQVTQP